MTQITDVQATKQGRALLGVFPFIVQEGETNSGATERIGREHRHDIQGGGLEAFVVVDIGHEIKQSGRRIPSLRLYGRAHR